MINFVLFLNSKVVGLGRIFMFFRLALAGDHLLQLVNTSIICLMRVKVFFIDYDFLPSYSSCFLLLILHVKMMNKLYIDMKN